MLSFEVPKSSFAFPLKNCNGLVYTEQDFFLFKDFLKDFKQVWRIFAFVSKY